VLLRGCDACIAVGGGLQSEAALIDVSLDVGSLRPVLPRRQSPQNGAVAKLPDKIVRADNYSDLVYCIKHHLSCEPPPPSPRTQRHRTATA